MTPVHAQSSKDATELLAKVKAFGESTKSWRAEAVRTGQVSLPGVNLKDEIHIRVAAEPLLKMSRVNSGDDRTTMVCNGAEYFYSGDGLSYYRHEATQQCDLPVIAFYEPPLREIYEPTPVDLCRSSAKITCVLPMGNDDVWLCAPCGSRNLPTLSEQCISILFDQ